MRFFGFTSIAAAVVSFTVCPGGSATAALIVGDDFETYPVGTLPGQNGGLSGSGTWNGAYVGNAALAVVSGGLSYANGDVNIQGGSQHARQNFIAGTTDQVLHRPFTGQTDTIYFSLLFRPDNGLDSNDFIQFILNDDPDHHNAASFGMKNVAGNPLFGRLRDNTMDYQQDSATGAVDDTTYLLVGKVSKVASANYNRFDLFVNPSTLTEPLTPSAFATGDSLTGTIDYFTMRVAGQDAGDRNDFDALRIGESYFDVVGPLNAAAIPEPSSLLLAGSALGLAAVRRFRRARSQ